MTLIPRRFNFVPWLSLRLVHCLAGSRGSFYQLVGWSRNVNLLSSMTACALFVAAAWHASWMLAGGPWIAWSTLVLLLGLFFFDRGRGWLCVLIGVPLVASAMSEQRSSLVLLGASVMAVGLALIWESREAMRVWSQKPLLLDNVNFGSATLLRGKVLVLHLFVSTRRRRWSRRARRGTMRQVEEACNWLSAEGRRFGAPLEFEHVLLSHVGVCFGGEIPCLGNDYAGREEFEAFLQQKLAVEGFARLGEAGASIRTNQFLLVHVAEDFGREAYAVPHYRTSATCWIDTEYAVVGAWRNAAIYAHEILHLFGADDFRRSKYIDSSVARTWDECSSSLLRRSIMFDGYFPLDQLVVDDMTAQCVGWQ